MSRLNTMLVRKEESRRYTPGSVRIIYILEGDKKGGPNAIIHWMENYKMGMF